MKLIIPHIKLKYPTYIVGGWVRDKLMDAASNPKDIDLCMLAPDFESMVEAVKEVGAEIYLETPQYLTIRCNIKGLGAVDVALGRRDGEYTDGRRPDSTEITLDIVDDLRRRDFTCNAIAVNVEDGLIVDPFNGHSDIIWRRLNAVGNARDRFSEDYLRMYRAIRFAITKGFNPEHEIDCCLRDSKFCRGLANISSERIREEMLKAFSHNTMITVRYLNEYENLLYWMVEKGVSLNPTLKEKLS